MTFAEKFLKSKKRSGDPRKPPANAGRTKSFLKRSSASDKVELDCDAQVGIDRALRFASRSQVDFGKDIRDAIRMSTHCIEKTIMTVDLIRDELTEVRNLMQIAKASEDHSKRSAIAEQHNIHLANINAGVSHAEVDEVNLLDGSGQNLNISLVLGRSLHFVVSHTCLTTGEAGLNLPEMDSRKVSDAELMIALNQIDAAFDILDKAAAAFCRDAEVLAEHFAQDA